MDPHDDIEELRKEAPTLFGMAKSDPFEVPSGFFDYFPHNLQEQVRGVKPGVQIPFWKGLVIALPLVLVIIGVTGILITMTNSPIVGSQPTFTVVDIEHVIDYEDPEELLALMDTEDLPDHFTLDMDLSDGSEDEFLIDDSIEILVNEL